MKKITIILSMFLISAFGFAQTIEGTWKMNPDAGAFKVGPFQGSGDWYSNSTADVTARACFFDDEFVFNSNGSFSNVNGSDTWVENWQDGAGDSCRTSVAPHDGSNTATWFYDPNAGTLTLNGVGAYLGLAKAINGSELDNPANAPASVTYLVSSFTSAQMVLDISVAPNNDVWWRFTFERQGVEPTCDDGVQNGDEEGVDCGGEFCEACPEPEASIINVDPAAAWIGYANVFDLNGGFAFGSGWALEDLKTDITSENIILKPNFNTWEEDPADDFWTTGGVGTSVANKIFEANTFIEDSSLADADLTFYGNVGSIDMPAGYTAIAFIKGLDPNNGYQDAVGATVALNATGEFTISATAAQLAPGLIIQYGFQVVGPIADPVTETARAITGISVGASSLGTIDFTETKFKVFPNPTANNWNVNSNTIIRSIAVYDILGKRVESITPNAKSAVINSSNLNSGMYFANIEGENGTKTIKLIKN